MGHSTEECHHLHYLVERMMRDGQLNKYIHSQTKPLLARQAASASAIGIEAKQVIYVIHE